MTKELSEAARLIGRKGGQSKSPKKQESSRRNGRLGGRPKKTLGRHESEERGESPIPALKCPQCKRINKIVNQCGCDPANMPTRLGVLYAAPDFNLAKTD